MPATPPLPRLPLLHRFLSLTNRRPFSTSVSPSSYPSPLPDLNPDHLASSLKHWFLSRSSPTSSPDLDLDPVFRALSSPSPDSTSSLPDLLPRLDERVVLRVLRHPSPLLLPKLRFFDWASRQPHFRHTRATLHAAFLLLSRSRLVSVVLDWLRSFSSSPSRHRRHHSFRFHDALVLGYAVAGRPASALQALARMRFLGLDLDSFGHHVLLNALLEHRSFDAADSILRQIADRGLSSPLTSLLTVKSLCLQGRLDDARLALPPAPSRAADRAVALVVSAFCRRGRFQEADELVESHAGPACDAAWVRSLLGRRRVDGAIEFLRKRKLSEAHVPETVNYNRLLYRLLREGRLEDTYNVLTEMRDSGITLDCATKNVVLCFLCKGGMVDVGLQLYNSSHEFGLTPNNLASNSLINALCGNGYLDEACSVLTQSMERGYFPGKRTFRLLADVLCREGKLDRMGDLLDAAMRRNTVPIDFACARYISALCKVGRAEEGYSVVTEKAAALSAPLSRHVYVGLVRGFVALRRGDMVCRVLMEMQDNGHVPSQKLYRDCVCCLCEVGRLDLASGLLQMQLLRGEMDQKTCYNYFIDGLGHGRRPELAKQVYEMMWKAGVQPNLSSQILVLQSYMKSKRVGDALRFFDELHMEKEPSIRMCNILIAGLCRASKPEPAMMIWEEVRKKGMIPSLYCYEELLKSLCSIKDYDATVKVIKDFEKTGRPLSPFICNLLLTHSLKSGGLRVAWFSCTDGKLENKLEPQHDGMVPMWPLLGNIVAAFSGGIRMSQQIDGLDEVLEKHIPVNLCTYNTLLRGLVMAKRMDLAFNLFHKMCKKGYTPNKWTYDIIIRGLCEMGRKKDAEVWMKKMYQNGFSHVGSTMDKFCRTQERAGC